MTNQEIAKIILDAYMQSDRCIYSGYNIDSDWIQLFVKPEHSVIINGKHCDQVDVTCNTIINSISSIFTKNVESELGFTLLYY